MERDLFTKTSRSITFFSKFCLPLTEAHTRNGGITMDCEYKGAAKNDAHNSMAITVQGHKVALFFADQPNTQVALKIKQALLGTYLTAGK